MHSNNFSNLSWSQWTSVQTCYKHPFPTIWNVWARWLDCPRSQWGKAMCSQSQDREQIGAPPSCCGSSRQSMEHTWDACKKTPPLAPPPQYRQGRASKGGKLCHKFVCLGSWSPLPSLSWSDEEEQQSHQHYEHHNHIERRRLQERKMLGKRHKRQKGWKVSWFPFKTSAKDTRLMLTNRAGRSTSSQQEGSEWRTTAPLRKRIYEGTSKAYKPLHSLHTEPSIWPDSSHPEKASDKKLFKI